MEKVLGALSKKVAYRSHLVFRLLLRPLHLVDPLAEVKVGILHLGADSMITFCYGEFIQEDIFSDENSIITLQSAKSNP